MKTLQIGDAENLQSKRRKFLPNAAHTEFW